MNDKTSVNGNLDLVMATPIQLVDLRKTPPLVLAQSILVAMPEEEGYAVSAGALAPTGSYRGNRCATS
jgi:uncharacterized membrane protein